MTTQNKENPLGQSFLHLSIQILKRLLKCLVPYPGTSQVGQPKMTKKQALSLCRVADYPQVLTKGQHNYVNLFNYLTILSLKMSLNFLRTQNSKKNGSYDHLKFMHFSHFQKLHLQTPPLKIIILGSKSGIFTVKLIKLNP